MIEAIRAYGGEVRTRSPVTRIRVEEGRVAGVVLAKTGEEIDAQVVVSNADLKRTILDLVGASQFAPTTIERVRSFQMSTPLFCVYLGLDVDLAALGIPNTTTSSSAPTTSRASTTGSTPVRSPPTPSRTSPPPPSRIR
jgi:phytoene dehydrogenase-like protein